MHEAAYLTMQTTDWRCETCNTSYQRREHYERHIRTHTKEKPFSCTECGQAFGRVDSLSRHHATVHQAAEIKSRAGERRRVTQACKPCNLSKVRCDGLEPCQRCQDHGINCYYSHKRNAEDTPKSPSSKRPQRPGTAEGALPSWEKQVDSAAEGFIPLPSMPISPPDPSGVEGMPTAALGDLDLFGAGITDFDNFLDLDLGADILPQIFQPDPSLDTFNDILSMEQEQEPPAHPVPNAAQPPTPLTPAAVTEIYNRHHSPVPETDALEPRQYNASSIDVDAQLIFPDMEHLPWDEVDQENYAHVHQVPASVRDNVVQLATTMQSSSSFPPFSGLNIPPVSVINVWVQLYFEHFHPVFPILHKTSFESAIHWLLVFVVAAIGAQFSELPNAQICSMAMHELVRRFTMYLCEHKNQNGRELWLTQTVLLNHLGLRYSGERRALEIAELLQALPVTLARRKRLFTNMVTPSKITTLDLPLNQKWQIWTVDEERRRAGFAIWLIDSAFRSHFDLTPLMRRGEMNNSLPQSEECWRASTAQGWASFPPRSGASKMVTLKNIIADGSWTTAWRRTGTLGRQAIIQLLLNNLYGHDDPSPITETQAEETLARLLSISDQEEKGVPMTEQKAHVAHRLGILAILMVSKSPRLAMMPAVWKIHYQKCSNAEMASWTAQWKTAPKEGRQALFYAAQVIQTIQSNYCVHFSTPVLLFKATLTLLLYSTLFCQDHASLPPDTQTPSIVLNAQDPFSDENVRWIESGRGRIKLSGIGNIMSPGGRSKLLNESISMMRALKYWGISKIYTQLLTRLQDN